MGRTKIEWASHVWNPIVGCSIVSPGCTNCYAMAMAARIEAAGTSGPRPSHYAGTTRNVNGNAVWTGKVELAPVHILTAPLHWKKPRRIFVNSMGDLFHEAVAEEWIDAVFAVMRQCRQHSFQVLTKRSRRMQDYLIARADHRAIVQSPNVWLGTSVERQQEADERRRALHKVAEAGWMTWVSYEPALGPVDWSGWEFIRWLVSGGESGPNARPSHPDWHRSARDWCKQNGIPYFFKQWGGWREPKEYEGYDTSKGRAGKPPAFIVGADGSVHCFASRYIGDDFKVMIRVGKQSAGRVLDGMVYNGFPEGGIGK